MSVVHCVRRVAAVTARRTFGLDERALSVFRVQLGVLLLYDLASRLPDLRAFYTDEGVWTRGTAIAYSNPARWSLHLLNGSAGFQLLLFAIAAVAATCLLVGYRTRLATVVSWIMLASLHSRNPLVQNGGDTMLLLCLFWSMFLPLGVRGSIDAVRRPARLRSSPYLSVGSVGLVVQIAAIYIVSALAKTGDAWHGDGTALFYALGLREITTPLAVWLQPHGTIGFVLTRFTYLLELCGPLLLLIPVAMAPIRATLFLAFAGFHFMTGMTMDLGLFPLIGIVVWAVLLPPSVWERIWPTPPGAAGSTAPDPSATARTRWHLLSATLARETVAAACLLVIVVVNVSVATGGPSMPGKLEPVLYATMLRQKWTMFSPQPSSSSRWVVAEVTLSDGRVIDGLTGAALRETPPEHAGEAFDNFRWRKYLIAVSKRRHRSHRDELLRYIRREVEETEGRGSVERITLQLFRDRLLATGDRSAARAIRLCAWSQADTTEALAADSRASLEPPPPLTGTFHRPGRQ